MTTTTAAERILVLGAGELGIAVLTAMTNHPNASRVGVSVLLRPSTISSNEPAKMRDISRLRELGVAPIPGDIAAAPIDELEAIFARFDTVVSCVGFAAGPGTQLKLAHAALRAGVERYYPWQFGVDYDAIGRGSPQDLFDEQLDVRDQLRNQHRTMWTIISTGMFTSFLFEPDFGVVDLTHHAVHALGDWDTAVTVTIPADIGTLTAEIVLAHPELTNQVVYLAGDTITYAALADIVERVLAVDVARVAWPVSELLNELAGEPTNTMKKYRAVFAQGVGVAWDKQATFNATHDIATITAEQWAHAHLPTRTATAER